MSETKKSSYLIGQEHLTDNEIDEIYNAAQELTLQLDEFRRHDEAYRKLEDVDTGASEKERVDLLNACILTMDKIMEILNGMEGEGKRVSQLFLKAKGALEEKLDIGK